GGTEEVVQSTKKAIEKKGLVTGISSGSKLVDTLSAGALPYYKFDPINNPSGQPRLGLGYMIFGVALILSKLGYIALDSSEVNQAVTKVKESNNVIKEKAGNFIEKIADDIAVFVSAEHLSGTSHIVRNQMNETAKAYADYHLIPELNHHLLEGLSYPKNKSLGFIFYDSSFYFNRNSRRITLTKQIVKKQNIKVLAVSFEAESKIEEFLKFLQFGSYLSFLLAKSRNLDPSVVPWVDYFKEQLAH
ncbi:MAG: SIS domain-containing protein, partial [Candidatus Paceibacterota bacterium]